MGMTTALVGLAVAGAAAGSAAVSVAARRNRFQPIESNVAAEQAVLGFLTVDPAQLLRGLGELDDTVFSSDTRRSIWRSIVDLVEPHLDDTTRVAVAAAQRDSDEPAMAAAIDALRPLVGGTALSADLVRQYLHDGGEILGAAAGRTQNTDRSPLVETGDDAVPYRREPSSARTGRVALGAVLGAIGAVIGGVFATMAADGAAAVWAAIAIVLVAGGGICVACVDLDTFYLDWPSFAVWAAATWGAALLYGIAGAGVGTILPGLIGALGVAAGFEAIARGWGKLRGITQGAGDTWIALVTAGVPAAIASDWRVAVWSVLAGSCGVVIAWSALAVRGRAGATTPVPFGPYLVGGAFAAAVVWMVIV
jgi:leader peptidase (prepilin peptidase)/N-methyltransferase